ISEGNRYAREGRVLVATLESSEGCSTTALTRARQLLADLEAAADRGNAIWRRIKEVTAEMDPTLFARDRDRLQHLRRLLPCEVRVTSVVHPLFGRLLPANGFK